MASTDLILLHGALGAASQFKPLIPILSQNLPDRKIHVLELEGHGLRAFPAHPFSIDSFVEDVVRQMDERGIERADIFGYSMGGYVALRLCMLHSHRVRKVFTFATKFAWSPKIAEAEVKMIDPEKILEKVPKFAETLQKRHRGNEWKAHLAKTAQLMRDLGNEPVLTTETMATISHPVKLGIGSLDKMVSHEETFQAYRALPNAELFELASTPHPIEQMDPERLCGAIADWLAWA